MCLLSTLEEVDEHPGVIGLAENNKKSHSIKKHILG